MWFSSHKALGKAPAIKVIVYLEAGLSSGMNIASAKEHFKGGWLLEHCPTQRKIPSIF
jgi:hypothetical protein